MRSLQWSGRAVSRPLAGVGDEHGDVRVIPGGGVQVVDRALAQVQVLLERGPARRETRIIKVAEDRDPRAMGRYSPCVGQSSCPTYIQPRSVIMSLGSSAGLCSTRHRHDGITGRWLPSASTRAYCTPSPWGARRPCRAW